MPSMPSLAAVNRVGLGCIAGKAASPLLPAGCTCAFFLQRKDLACAMAGKRAGI